MLFLEVVLCLGTVLVDLNDVRGVDVNLVGQHGVRGIKSVHLDQ